MQSEAELPLSLGIQANTQQNDLDEQITQTGQTTAAHSYYGVDGYLMHHTIHVQVPCKVDAVYFKHETKCIDKDYHYLVSYSFSSNCEIFNYLRVFFVWKPTLNKNFDANWTLIMASSSASGLCNSADNTLKHPVPQSDPKQNKTTLFFIRWIALHELTFFQIAGKIKIIRAKWIFRYIAIHQKRGFFKMHHWNY